MGVKIQPKQRYTESALFLLVYCGLIHSDEFKIVEYFNHNKVQHIEALRGTRLNLRAGEAHILSLIKSLKSQLIRQVKAALTQIFNYI